MVFQLLNFMLFGPKGYVLTQKTQYIVYKTSDNIGNVEFVATLCKVFSLFEVILMYTYLHIVF